MSLVIFPAVKPVDPLTGRRPTDVWICRLCTKCGWLERAAPGDRGTDHLCAAGPAERSGGERYAVIAVLDPDEQAVRRQLTKAGVQDHTITRVINIIYDRDQS